MKTQRAKLPPKVIQAVFFCQPGSRPPTEPVRDWLVAEGPEAMKTIGADIMLVECYWPIVQEVRPQLIKHLRGGVWEVRSTLPNRIARVLFAVASGQMILLHGFIKKSRATPTPDLELALRRLRQWKSMESS